MIDHKNLRNGDVVHVRGTIKTSALGPYLALGYENTVPLGDLEIVHIVPRPLEVGDKVLIGAGMVVWEIRAIDGENIWVLAEEGTRKSGLLSEFRRAV